MESVSILWSDRHTLQFFQTSVQENLNIPLISNPFHIKFFTMDQDSSKDQQQSSRAGRKREGVFVQAQDLDSLREAAKHENNVNS